MAGRLRMTRRNTTKELSSFSWKREARISAAKQRLSKRADVSAVQPERHPSPWQILAYSMMAIALLGAIFGVIAFTVRWLWVKEAFQR